MGTSPHLIMVTLTMVTSTMVTSIMVTSSMVTMVTSTTVSLDHGDLGHVCGLYCVWVAFFVTNRQTDKAILGSRIIAKGTVFCYVSANSSPYILELHI